MTDQLEKLIEATRRDGRSAGPARRAGRAQTVADEVVRLNALAKERGAVRKPKRVRVRKSVVYTRNGHVAGNKPANGLRLRRTRAAGALPPDIFALLVLARNVGRGWVGAWLVAKMVQRKEARTELRALERKGLVEARPGPQIRLKRALMYRLTDRGWALAKMME